MAVIGKHSSGLSKKVKGRFTKAETRHRFPQDQMTLTDVVDSVYVDGLCPRERGHYTANIDYTKSSASYGGRYAETMN